MNQVKKCFWLSAIIAVSIIIFNNMPITQSHLRDVSDSIIDVDIPHQCVESKPLYKGLAKATTKSVDILNSETQSTICVKDRKDDRLISGKILDNGAWEEKEVNLMMKMVDQYPEAIFLDIGSNLGILFVLVL